jgi:hypothetical protein
MAVFILFGIKFSHGNTAVLSYAVGQLMPVRCGHLFHKVTYMCTIKYLYQDQFLPQESK